MSDTETTAGSDELDALVEGRCAEPFGLLGPRLASGSPGDGWVVRAFRPHADAVALQVGDARRPMRRVHAAGVYEATLEPSGGAAGPDPPGYRLELTWPGGETETIEDPYRFPPAVEEETLSRFAAEGSYHVHRFLGARVIEHAGVEGTDFAVWAPNAHHVSLMGDFNGWDARLHPMRRRGESGVWELFLPGIGPGARYKYHVCGAPEEVGDASRTREATAETKRAGPQTDRRGRKGDRRPGDTGEPSRVDKADPVGFAAELRPATASVVWDLTRYRWEDAEWMAARVDRHAADAPLSIYEAHLGSWRRPSGADGGGPGGWLGYRELAEALLPYVKEMGFTHIELLPVTEHPHDDSWGYQTVGYFAPTARYGSPDEFRHFVDTAHRLGIGVILDWVPAHFPRDAHGLARFDGTHLYDHEDPRRGAHPEWGTQIYDYGHPGVRSFLISSALFWLEEYHIDGLRVDAVASMLYLDYARAKGEWLPNEFGGRENLEAIDFVRKLNDAVHEAVPEALVFAEESTAWPRVTDPTGDGGLGFDMKWKMGWMNDTLSYMQTPPASRPELHDKLTFSLTYAFQERFLLPLSHDEVVHLKRSLLSKMPGDEEERFANLRLLFAYMWAHPGRKLLFMGGEFGQRGEWDHRGELEWDLLEKPRHRGVQALVRTLNRIYRSEPALHELAMAPEGFEWIDPDDRSRSVVSFLRRARDWRDIVVVAANFSDRRWEDYRVGVPFAGDYRMVLTTDDPAFEDPGSVEPAAPAARLRATETGDADGHGWSLTLTLPPLSAVYLARG